MNEAVKNPVSVGSVSAAEAATLERGKKVFDRLRSGDLPQMVDWFDPGLLAKVGVRTVISSTLGSYTDQRLMQAATDNVSDETELANRYNFSGEKFNGAGQLVPCERLTDNADDPVWIDYIADLGDGFEATYAMAYLLAADELKVEGVEAPLPAGKLLIMGGDQVYPDATKQEYEKRLRDPYDWAFSTDNPKRKLFAIPGNHDWYDGLSAFSALFCSARDRISKGLGTQIGGWRCQQHRSYFAIKLPHNWWIWGPDIQLADNLDDSQRDYFDLMAEQTMPGNYIILCIAEPSWLHKNYDNLHEISMLARKHHAKICAVIAGDWHHYSRYYSEELGIQFVTAGGGGAFAHATHGLKNGIDLIWATPAHADKTAPSKPVASKADSDAFNRMEKTVMGADGTDFTQNPVAETAGNVSPDESAAPEPKPGADLDAGPLGIGRRLKGVRKEEIEKKTYACAAKSIYPPKFKSRLLCLKNLALPFRNRPFTYLVGLIYFIYAWAFIAADPRQSPITRSMVESISIELASAQKEVQKIDAQILQRETDIKNNQGNTALQAFAERDAQDLQRLKDARGDKQAAAGEIEKRRNAVLGTADTKFEHDLAERAKAIFDDEKLGIGGKLLAMSGALMAGTLGLMFDTKALWAAAELSPMFAFMLLGLWAGLVFYVESESKIVKLVIGTAHAAAHIAALLFISWFANVTGIVPRFIGGFMSFSDDITRVVWNIFVSLFAGGLLGGFVMGLYWTLTSTLFNMHTGDAFGALGIKDYKNFLRIKLEPGRATIYPIALDRVPGRKGWRWQMKKGEQRPAHNPQILPVRPLEPRLIESAPIVIEAHMVLP
ncbi:MAG: hypothetical protein ABL897_02065 [Hyphomicrobium sp.]